MQVFKIPDTLAEKYRGAGHALAASVNDQLVDLVYLRDALTDFDLEDPELLLINLIEDPRLGPTVRYLSSLGQVHVGMCSCWEFIRL